MKRDLDLIRTILLVAEEMPAGGQVSNQDIPVDATRAHDVSEHVKLLESVGFIKASISETVMSRQPTAFVIQGIHWAGYEYLDAVRDESVWKNTVEKLRQVGGSASLDVVKAVAGKVMLETLGI